MIMRLINFRTVSPSVKDFFRVIKSIKRLHKSLPYFAICLIETKHSYSIRFHILKSKIYPSQSQDVRLLFKRLISLLQ